MGTITVTPSISDPDNGDTVTISAVINKATGTKPSFIMIATDQLSFTVNPKLMSQVGTHTIDVSITDTKATVKSSFNLTVEGIKPSFLPEPPIPEIIEVMAGV
jgi:hypothetical protein